MNFGKFAPNLAVSGIAKFSGVKHAPPPAEHPDWNDSWMLTLTDSNGVETGYRAYAALASRLVGVIPGDMVQITKQDDGTGSANVRWSVLVNGVEPAEQEPPRSAVPPPAASNAQPTRVSSASFEDVCEAYHNVYTYATNKYAGIEDKEGIRQIAATIFIECNRKGVVVPRPRTETEQQIHAGAGLETEIPFN